MDGFDAPVFKERTLTSHSAKLHEEHPLTPKVAQILDEAFDHQIAVFDVNNSKRGIKARIAHHFYSKCYLTPQLRLGAGGAIQTIVNLKAALVEPVIDSSENRLIYLTGEAGSGKTALINKLITVEGLCHHGGPSWFVRVDLEDSFPGGEPWRSNKPELVVLEKIANQFQKVLTTSRSNIIPSDISHLAHGVFLNHLEALIVAKDAIDGYQDMPNQAGLITREICQKISNLVEWIRSTCHRHLILILDNVDAALHTQDRQCFNLDTEPVDKKAIMCIPEVVQLFLHSQHLQNLGARILVSMRSDSYEIISGVGKLSLPRGKHLRYNLDNLDLQKVLGCRCSLLEHICELKTSPEAIETYKKEFGNEFDRIPYVDDKDPIPPQLNPAKYLANVKVTRKGNYVKSKIDELNKHFQPIQRLARDLRSVFIDGGSNRASSRGNISKAASELLNHSWRDTMEFFKDIALQLMSSPDGVDRLVRSRTSSTLAIILSNHLMYSQLRSRFPNIFLVVMQRRAGSPPSQADHPHSYWVKYLIATYLVSQPTNQIKIRDVFTLFCPSAGGGYCAKLVEECLGSLGDAKGSRMLKRVMVETLEGEAETRIAVLPRATYFMEHLVDEFVYLQCVVDDHMLPLPSREAFSEFFNDFTFTHWPNYRYLVSQDSEEHNRGVKEMIEFKAKRVLDFLHVLDGSLEAEREMFPVVFQAFERSAIALPSIDTIRANVKKWISDLNESLNQSFFDPEKYDAETKDKGKQMASNVKQAMLNAHRARCGHNMPR